MGLEVTSTVEVETTPEKAIGIRLREFRLARRLSLRALAKEAQTSPGFLSQLERGQVNASVGTLRKLASALGIMMSDLFRDDDVNQPTVLRRSHRPEIHASNLTSKYLLSRKPLRNFEVYAGEFQPGGSAGDAYTHGDAQEMIVVLAGTIILELAGIEYQLMVGDSVDYRTSIPHTARNDTNSLAELLWIISPPTTSSS